MVPQWRLRACHASPYLAEHRALKTVAVPVRPDRNRAMPHASLPADDLDHVLTHTRDLWERARGQRIFLTGGTGFFGPWLVETFAHANEALDLEATLVVLTRDP